MRTMRLGVAPVVGAVLAAGLSASAVAQQPEPYHATLYFGTGLINIPVAWVSPRSGDVWMNTSAKNLPAWPDPGQLNMLQRWNSNIAFDSHWAGRVSLGAVAYSQNPEYGFFGQLLLLRGNDLGFLPSVAIGARNVGPYSHEDRYFIGEDISLGTDSTYHHIVAGRYEKFKTSPTLYAVATKDFAFGRGGSSGASFSVGWGNGLFSDDGGLGKFYNKSGTIAKGLFLGARYTTRPTLNTTLTLMAENDGWDYNTGAVIDWRGLTAGFYLTGVEEGTTRSAESGWVYNYMKSNVSVGYTGNVVDIAHGILLRTRITELTREQQRLRYEIAERNRKIAGLEVALRGAQASELANIESRRKDLEKQVQEERDAVRQAQERLQALERGGTPPAPSPSPTTPPATPPSSTTPSSTPSTSPSTPSTSPTTPSQPPAPAPTTPPSF